MIEGAAVPGWFQSLKKQKPDAIFDYGRPGGTWALFLNMTRKPLDDIRVRQAIAHAIDPTAWINAFGDDNAVPPLSSAGGSRPSSWCKFVM